MKNTEEFSAQARRRQSCYSKFLRVCESWFDASVRVKFIIFIRAQLASRYLFRAGLLILILCFNISLFAQEQEQLPAFLTPPPEKGELWFSPSAEIALYSKHSFSYGAGFAAAYGKKASIGIKGVFLLDEQDELDVLEMHFLFRLYLLSGAVNSGPFFQFTGGPVIFFPRESGITLPAEFGLFSAGINFGWRFLPGNTVFIEPSIRGGYPFIVGGALSLGLRF